MCTTFADIFLVSHSPMKANSFPLNSSITTTCVPLKRLDTSGSNSPPHPGKVQIPHPQEGLLCQIPYSPGTDDSQIPVGCPGGMSKLRIYRRIIRRQNIAVNLSWKLKSETVIQRKQFNKAKTGLFDDKAKT